MDQVNIKQAVIILYMHPDDSTQILSVSRKDDHNMKGLPGGKIDDRETFLTAVIREVKEELGITINPLACEFLYQAIEGQFDTSTYLYKNTLDNLPETPFINQEGALVEYVPVEHLIDPNHSPFYEYNLAMFRNLLKQELNI